MEFPIASLHSSVQGSTYSLLPSEFDTEDLSEGGELRRERSFGSVSLTRISK